MHLVLRAVWLLLGLFAYLGDNANAAAGVLEIDVVFPRSNEAYAPTDTFPMVFALQNAQLAKHLAPSIISFVWNGTNTTFGESHHDLTNSNYSTEPYFVYHWLKIDTEGPYRLFSTASWTSCNVTGDKVSFDSNTTNFSVDFIIKRDAQAIDLVAISANDNACSATGIAINVTDETREVPETLDRQGGTCAVLAPASPTTAANPCRVKVDTAVDASMSAVLHDLSCKGVNPPADCPKENVVQQLAVAGVASFVAALGAIGFLLA